MPDTPDEELVRRLLAEARHDEPLPADVAARLDAVLDDLRAERRRSTTTAVTPLRRPRDARRRRWATGLVAAAAVVVAGVVAGVTVDRLGSGGSGGAGSAADSSAGGKALGEAPESAGGVVELHRATLAGDVRRAAAHAASGSAVMPPLPDASFPCATADWGPGTPVPARLDGVPAVLVLRPPANGHEVADVLECGTARVLASVTVPAR